MTDTNENLLTLPKNSVVQKTKLSLADKAYDKLKELIKDPDIIIKKSESNTAVSSSVIINCNIISDYMRYVLLHELDDVDYLLITPHLQDRVIAEVLFTDTEPQVEEDYTADYIEPSYVHTVADYAANANMDLTEEQCASIAKQGDRMTLWADMLLYRQIATKFDGRYVYFYLDCGNAILAKNDIDEDVQYHFLYDLNINKIYNGGEGNIIAEAYIDINEPFDIDLDEHAVYERFFAPKQPQLLNEECVDKIEQAYLKIRDYFKNKKVSVKLHVRDKLTNDALIAIRGSEIEFDDLKTLSEILEGLRSIDIGANTGKNITVMFGFESIYGQKEHK